MKKWGSIRVMRIVFMSSVLLTVVLLFSGCLGFVSEKPLVTADTAFQPLEGNHGFSIYTTSFIIQRDDWRYTISTLNKKYELFYAAFRALNNPKRVLMQVWEQNTENRLYWYYLLEKQEGKWWVLNFNLEQMASFLKQSPSGGELVVDSLEPVLLGNKALSRNVPFEGIPIEWIGSPPVIQMPADQGGKIDLKDVWSFAKETLETLAQNNKAEPAPQPEADDDPLRNECFELALPPDMADQLGWEGLDIEDLDAETAEPVCREAVQKYPDDLYLKATLGRVLDKARKFDQALPYYQEAADQGIAFAQDNLGDLYFYGSGMPQDYEKAAYWYKLGADQGHARSQADLGYLYETGKGVLQDYEKAAHYYQLSADQGFARAQNNLAYFYEVGQGVAQDYAKSVELNRLSADQGYVRAQADLGYLYETGKGVTRDYEKAAEYYKLAADQGYARAQNNLGNLYFSGRGVPKDYEKAAYWYGKAADQDYAKAQNNLGELYENGQGVSQDYKKAADLYKLSAGKDYARAQANLAYLYEHGDGVSMDFKKAFELYEAAADQGYARAQNALGDFYYYGKEMTQDYEKAVEFYKLAAEQGNALAQNNLGHCYRVGEGVPKDLEKAKYYYSLAAEQGLPGGKDGLKRVEEELSGQ